MLTLSHDCSHDVLYIGIGDRSNSYGDELSNGVVVLHDMDTEKITGVTILDFLQKYKSNDLSALSLPIKIDFIKDVIPYLNLH